MPEASPPPSAPNIFSILIPYRQMIAGLVLLALVANLLTLVVPQITAGAIDAYSHGTLVLSAVAIKFLSVAFGIFFFTLLQSIMQTYVSERVARDMRAAIVAKISRQGYRFIEDKNPSKLLTNVTSDIDSIKSFVSQVVVSLVSSGVIIIGAAVLLLMLDWRLALVVLLVIPIIGGTFFMILSRVRLLFKASREVIDWLNKVISESILGAALIRVLNSGRSEHDKFASANARARELGLKILRLFSFMIPIITFVSSLAILAVVTLGGYFVVNGSMTIGSFAAFMGYIAILIFPILIIGFMSNLIAQATTSYARIYEILQASDEKDAGTLTAKLTGAIEVRDVTVMYGEKPALKEVSLTIAPHTRTAIIGPTAAGKTQLLNVMAGLTMPQKGEVLYDGHALGDYVRKSFYPQIGLVFQDSVLFNTTMRENIAFSTAVSDESLEKAIQTAELTDFISTLPSGLDTLVSERGTSLSGGQKQRVMLARALALSPSILFLDDFTARVDARTEALILGNITRNYPNITLVSITQKIAPIESYEKIVLLMEGEVLAQGTHEQLMQSSPEYVQIYESQKSTSTYEIRS